MTFTNMNEYAEHCDAAARDQGLYFIVDDLVDAGHEPDIRNSGGYCMAMVLEEARGSVVITGWDTEPGVYHMGAYRGTGWEDGDDPVQFAENVVADDVVGTVATFFETLVVL